MCGSVWCGVEGSSKGVNSSYIDKLQHTHTHTPHAHTDHTPQHATRDTTDQTKNQNTHHINIPNNSHPNDHPIQYLPSTSFSSAIPSVTLHPKYNPDLEPSTTAQRRTMPHGAILFCPYCKGFAKYNHSLLTYPMFHQGAPFAFKYSMIL